MFKFWDLVFKYTPNESQEKISGEENKGEEGKSLIDENGIQRLELV